MNRRDDTPRLSKRLRAIADFVRPGAVLADVGTDHAMLPACLLLEGRIRHAIASDLAHGPLARAGETIRHTGVQGVTLLCCDGLRHPDFERATDIVVAGMGGELVANIIDNAPHLWGGGRRFILQPMTRDAHLRRYLLERGFAPGSEVAVLEGEHAYTVIETSYDAKPRRCDPVYAQIGPLRSADGDAASVWIARRLHALEQKLCGLARSDRQADAARALRELIVAIREADR